MSGIEPMVRVVAVALLAAAMSCGGASEKKADSPDDEAAAAAAQATWAGDLKAGTPVCIGDLSGVRYVFEDALTERSLEIADDCMSADVELAEGSKNVL